MFVQGLLSHEQRLLSRQLIRHHAWTVHPARLHPPSLGLQLVVNLLLQVAACRGQEGDATPFTEVTVENISEELSRLGYHSRGWETMYNGHTGRQLQVCLAGRRSLLWGREAVCGLPAQQAACLGG